MTSELLLIKYIKITKVFVIADDVILSRKAS